MQVSTFSFGQADLSYMQAISEIGFGETYVIDSPDAIASAFGLALAGLLTTVATRIQITLTPVGGCSITELLQSGQELTAPSEQSPAQYAPSRPRQLLLQVCVCVCVSSRPAAREHLCSTCGQSPAQCVPSWPRQLLLQVCLCVRNSQR